MASVGTQFPQFSSLDDVSKMTPVLFPRMEEGKQTHFDQRQRNLVQVFEMDKQEVERDISCFGSLGFVL